MKKKALTVNADVARRLAAEGDNTMQGGADADNQVQVAVRLGDSSYSAV